MLERASSERKELAQMGDMNCNQMKPLKLFDDLSLITEDSNLKQLISVPTRTTGNSQTLTDLLFPSNREHFSSTSAVVCTGSDHLMIYGEHEEKISAIPQTCTVRSFKRCDKDTMLTELHRAPWQVMDIFFTIDGKWEYWNSLFLSIVNIHAPFVKVWMKRDSLVWIDEDIHKLMRARNSFQKKHQKTRDHEDWEAFKI